MFVLSGQRTHCGGTLTFLTVLTHVLSRSVCINNTLHTGPITNSNSQIHIKHIKHARKTRQEVKCVCVCVYRRR